MGVNLPSLLMNLDFVSGFPMTPASSLSSWIWLCEVGLSLAWAWKRLPCPGVGSSSSSLHHPPSSWLRVPLIHPGIYQGFIEHPLSTRHGGAQNWCEGRGAWRCQQRTFFLRGRQTTNKDVKESQERNGALRKTADMRSGGNRSDGVCRQGGVETVLREVPSEQTPKWEEM